MPFANLDTKQKETFKYIDVYGQMQSESASPAICTLKEASHTRNALVQRSHLPNITQKETSLYPLSPGHLFTKCQRVAKAFVFGIMALFVFILFHNWAGEGGLGSSPGQKGISTACFRTLWGAGSTARGITRASRRPKSSGVGKLIFKDLERRYCRSVIVAPEQQ